MKPVQSLTFKVASTEDEFAQIHRLNYRTFVEEIPQHAANPQGVLVDRFDAENTYLICLCGDQVVAMSAVRGKRPFSLDQKISDLDAHLPAGRSVCEVRLLAVAEEHRRGPVFAGLLQFVVRHCIGKGYDLAVISGTVRQQKLYLHLGFVPFGPLVGKAEALYQPMYLTLETFTERSEQLADTLSSPAMAHPQVNLLPGPVSISLPVRRVFADIPVSHRSDTFMADFQQTKQLLCSLVNGCRVEILTGSGTLANDAIACQLSLLGKPGVVLSNGEFGDRLVDHATRAGLDFAPCRVEWGGVFTRADVVRALDANPAAEWLWAVHCETSSGVLNDLAMLKELCAARNIRLCMDCISSIGTVPVDLGGVWFASGVSGKGLGAFPGLALVFYEHQLFPASRGVPRYLDLGYYAACAGVPFTHPSNLLYALKTALERFSRRQPFAELRELSSWLKAQLVGMGFRLLADGVHATPAVVTIALPEGTDSVTVGDRLERAGFLLSYKSIYLVRRNWIQICLMGECSREMLLPLLDRLAEVCPTGSAGNASAMMQPGARQ
jgi:aspartate aminotransferase-like enzyme/GNAT superfamily N-acetyltransferase